jgi:hypothetical protein
MSRLSELSSKNLVNKKGMVYLPTVPVAQTIRRQIKWRLAHNEPEMMSNEVVMS